MARTFTRQEFYDLVWSKPLTKLAKEFMLSDVALHKICRKHDIPHPPLGWWAKKAAGKPVSQTPLPAAPAGSTDRVTIAGGDTAPESEQIAAVRENARILASSIDDDMEAPSNPIVARTAAKLRKTDPSQITGLVSIDGAGVIKAEIAPASVDRFELAFNRIVAAADALGIQLDAGDQGAHFIYNEEMVAFSVSEGTNREKHVLTEKEALEKARWERKRERYWARRSGGWDDPDFNIFGPKFAEWDYHPTGRLALEFENSYVDGKPRRSFRDAKVQRIEKLATDIAVSIVIYATAKRDERLRREEEARQRLSDRQRRELALRKRHVSERRGAALQAVLDEIASLERLRTMIDGLGREQVAVTDARVSELLSFAQQSLAAREQALSAEGLARRFEEQRLFGDDDDHDFKLPAYFY